MPVEFTAIPAANSSEEAIMNALASGTEPDISTNIFIGFASQLVDVGQIEDLSRMPGFQETIQKRQMASLLSARELNGKQTVLPVYINPIVWWWRGDLLKQYGFDRVPVSYDELYALAKRRAADNHGYVIQLTAGKTGGNAGSTSFRCSTPRATASRIWSIKTCADHACWRGRADLHGQRF